jgi:signal transduction histidine kinase
VLGVVGVTRDITERKRYENQLERQNERLERFASVVSHDLRNPLNVAEGYLANYRETADPADLDEIEAAHDRMRVLIEDLLELARSGDVVAETVEVDLESTASEAWASVETAGATLEVEDGLTLLADPNRLRDVFANLFRNSVEHNATERGAGDEPASSSGDEAAGPGSRSGVTVRVGALEDGRGFYVADDGVGIPASERERVFETGYTSAADGTGFGLAIVSQVAHAHGWSVSITDSASGGTRFEFTEVETGIEETGGDGVDGRTGSGSATVD